MARIQALGTDSGPVHGDTSAAWHTGPAIPLQRRRGAELGPFWIEERATGLGESRKPAGLLIVGGEGFLERGVVMVTRGMALARPKLTCEDHRMIKRKDSRVLVR